jgi:hypothetical protein
MPTDDELVTALRRGMRANTANLNPAPGLAADVRQRSHQAHTRRVAAYVAMPVVAGAATVAALLVGGNPTGTAPAPPAAVATPRPTPTTTAPTLLASPASYQLRDAIILPQCPADAKGAPIGKTDAGVWYWTKEETCILVVIDWSDTKPAAAEPVSVTGYPGLYGLTTNGEQTIYAPVAPNTNPFHQAGGWIVLTAAADVPPDEYVKLIIPSS